MGFITSIKVDKPFKIYVIINAALNVKNPQSAHVQIAAIVILHLNFNIWLL